MLVNTITKSHFGREEEKRLSLHAWRCTFCLISILQNFGGGKPTLDGEGGEAAHKDVKQTAARRKEAPSH